jgi:hypothetical protein
MQCAGLTFLVSYVGTNVQYLLHIIFSIISIVIIAFCFFLSQLDRRKKIAYGLLLLLLTILLITNILKIN